VKVSYFTKHPIFVFVYNEACLTSNSLDPSLPSSVSSLLQEFEDLFPEETPSGLSSIRGIEHQIDFIPGATIQTSQPIGAILKKSKNCKGRLKSFWKKDM